MAGQRKCGACGEPGHTRRTCADLKDTVEQASAHVHAFTREDDRSVCACGVEDTTAMKAERAAALSAPEPAVDDFEDPSPRKVMQDVSGRAYDVTDGPVGAPAVDDFEDPSPAVEKRSETNNRGYLAKDPTLGDFRRYKNGNIKPITRVSTFIKAGSDRTALTDWNMRNVLLGCAHFPEIAAQAKVLHPNPEGPLPEDKDTKKELDRIVDDVSERVGSKRAANEGTNVHRSIEKYARGEWGYDDMPTHHVPWVQAFVAELDRKGLELVPDLVECTIYVPQFGGVMGRFDQALREKRTGRVLMSDVKTGSLDYAWREIQGQLAMYEAGYRQHGTYVWHPTDASQDRWQDPKYTLDQDEGLVIHLPVKSGQPSCYIYKANLAEGRDHVKLCAQNREAARNAPKPEEWVPAIEPRHLVRDGSGIVWDHPGIAADCTSELCRPAPEPGPCCHPYGYTYADDGNGHSGSFCEGCGAPEPEPAPEPEEWDWEPRFRMVQSKAEASGLWQSATSAGVAQDEIQRLVAIARNSLTERGLWS